MFRAIQKLVNPIRYPHSDNPTKDLYNLLDSFQMYLNRFESNPNYNYNYIKYLIEIGADVNGQYETIDPYLEDEAKVIQPTTLSLAIKAYEYHKLHGKRNKTEQEFEHIRYMYFEIIKILIQAGADPFQQLNTKMFVHIPIPAFFYASKELILNILKLIRPLSDQQKEFLFIENVAFVPEGFIGHGVYGTVYKGIDKNRGDHVAIKYLPFKRLYIIDDLSEVEILLGLNCGNKAIICTRYIFFEDLKIKIITDYIDGSTLDYYIYNKVDPSVYLKFSGGKIEFIRKEIMALLEGLNYIHELGIAHNDLKGDNIIIDNKTMLPVIIDFGMSCSNDNIVFKNAVTCKNEESEFRTYINYEAPEKIEAKWNLKNIDLRKSDIWTMGIIFYIWLNGEYPFNLSELPALKIQKQKEYHQLDEQIGELEEQISMSTLDLEGRKLRDERDELVDKMYSLDPEVIENTIMREIIINNPTAPSQSEDVILNTVINSMLIKDPNLRLSAKELLNLITVKHLSENRTKLREYYNLTNLQKLK